MLVYANGLQCKDLTEHLAVIFAAKPRNLVFDGFIEQVVDHNMNYLPELYSQMTYGNACVDIVHCYWSVKFPPVAQDKSQAIQTQQ
jgi:hypothetical protein